MPIETDVALAKLTTMGVGGRAKTLIWAENREELRSAVKAHPKATLLGGGSNMVIADAGIDETVIAVRTCGIELRNATDGHALVRCEAGEPWDDMVQRSVNEGLSGLECLSGIPGLAGATPIQNVGAYGQEVKDTIVSVDVLDRTTNEATTLTAEQCKFRYRDSMLKSEHRDRYVVLSVLFSLSKQPPARPQYRELANALSSHPEPLTSSGVREVVIQLRRAKSMVFDKSDPDSQGAGSFFTNALLDETEMAHLRTKLGDLADSLPTFGTDAGKIKVPAAWLIEKAGFVRGTTRGKARLSRKHALAIVNDGDASAADIVGLAREIQRGVFDRFGVLLEPEPVFLGFDEYPLNRK